MSTRCIPAGGEAFVQYLNTMAARSEIPVEQPEMDENSHIIVLSTCAASDTTGRFVGLGVQAEPVMISQKEE